MNFKVVLSVFLSLLFLGTHAEAKESHWVLFGQEKMFDHFYDDANFIRTEEDVIGVWIKTVPKEKVAKEALLEMRRMRAFIMEGYEDYQFTVTAMEINCPKKERALMESRDYGKDGKMLDKVGAVRRNWLPIEPNDHPHAFYLKVLCKKHLNQ